MRTLNRKKRMIEMKQKRLAFMIVTFVMITSLFLMTVSGLSDGQYIRANVNGDTEIDMKDILLLRKYVAGLSVQLAEHTCANTSDGPYVVGNMNGDSEIDMKDVLLLRKLIAGIDVEIAEHNCAATPSNPTQVSTTTSTKITTTTTKVTTTTTKQTTPTTQVTGDMATLSLNVTELVPDKYSTVTRTDSYSVSKGNNTFAIILPSVWHAPNDFPESKAVDLANLSFNGVHQTPVVTYGETISGNNDIILTYTIDVTADISITGSVSHPSYKQFVVSINGQGQEGPTKPTKDSTPIVPEENADMDLVTLTFADETANTYGISFHSATALSAPKVQVVQGSVLNASGFAGATEFACTSTSAQMGEFEGYNPRTYDFYYTNATVVTSYQHTATLTGLNPGTTYSYRVGDTATGKWSPIYVFKTKPATVIDFSFIFTADFQPELDEEGLMYKGVAQVLNAADNLCPDPAFILHGGDFVYTDANGQNGISQWRNVINGCNNWNEVNKAYFAEVPWSMAAGNHENHKLPFFFNNDNQAVSGDTKSFYYSFDYGDMHIVSLDTDVLAGAGVNDAMLNWLRNDLSSTTKKWKIVQTHYSFYVNTNRDLEDYGTSDTDRTTLLNMFDQYGVDIVLSAHVVQNYYTTYPINAGAVTTTSTTRQNGVDYYTNPGGTIYLQNGASGNSFGKRNDEGKINGYGWSYPSLMKDSEAGHYGSFAVIKLEGNALTVNRYYLDESDKSVKTYQNGQFGIIKN